MFWLAALALSSCAGPRLDVGDLLSAESGAESRTTEAETTGAFRSPAYFDARAATARDAALAAPESVETLVAAARALFIAAEARMQDASLAHIDELTAPTLSDAVYAAESLSTDLHAEVEALSTEGRDLARRALGLSPEDRGALLYRAAHAALLAWSVGVPRALFEGLGADCVKTAKASLAADEAYNDAAPLRLRGLFLATAPWPLGDRDQAVTLLRRATEIAPVTVNWLFLGDALFSRGDRTEAHGAWLRAANASQELGAAPLFFYHRELARRRVALGLPE